MRRVFLSAQRCYFFLNSYIKLQVSTCLDHLQEMSILKTQEGSTPNAELCLSVTLHVSRYCQHSLSCSNGPIPVFLERWSVSCA
jgi:hypothetical protein